MVIHITTLTIFVSLLFLCIPTCASENTTSALLSKKNIAPHTIDWTELMPEEDLKILESMEPVDHDALSQEELAEDTAPKNNSLRANAATSRFEESVASAISATKNPNQRTYKDVLNSYDVRPEFNNKRIKIAGYIVPIDYNDKNIVTSFFLVPYFGACTHVPPPPPNQIIYVRIPQGIKLFEIHNPFWVVGSLKVETTEKEIGASAYSLDAESVKPYQVQ